MDIFEEDGEKNNKQAVSLSIFTESLLSVTDESSLENILSKTSIMRGLSFLLTKNSPGVVSICIENGIPTIAVKFLEILYNSQTMKTTDKNVIFGLFSMLKAFFSSSAYCVSVENAIVCFHVLMDLVGFGSESNDLMEVLKWMNDIQTLLILIAGRYSFHLSEFRSVTTFENIVETCNTLDQKQSVYSMNIKYHFIELIIAIFKSDYPPNDEGILNCIKEMVHWINETSSPQMFFIFGDLVATESLIQQKFPEEFERVFDVIKIQKALTLEFHSAHPLISPYDSTLDDERIIVAQKLNGFYYLALKIVLSLSSKNAKEKFIKKLDWGDIRVFLTHAKDSEVDSVIELMKCAFEFESEVQRAYDQSIHELLLAQYLCISMDKKLQIFGIIKRIFEVIDDSELVGFIREDFMGLLLDHSEIKTLQTHAELLEVLSRILSIYNKMNYIDNLGIAELFERIDEEFMVI